MNIPESIELGVREVLRAHGRLSADAMTLPVAENLYESGMTSHSSVNVMLGLEDRWGVEFPDHLLTRDTFMSVQRIAETLMGLGVKA
jgi:acyl carrier protein